MCSAGLSWTDPDIYTLMLAQSLIGSYDSSKGGAQFSGAKLASKLGTMGTGVRLMQPFCTCYNDTGLFGVYMASNMDNKEKVDDLFATVQEELVALTTGTADEDLEMAKNQLKYNMMLQMDGTSANAVHTAATSTPPLSWKPLPPQDPSPLPPP